MNPSILKYLATGRQNLTRFAPAVKDKINKLFYSYKLALPESDQRFVENKITSYFDDIDTEIKAIDRAFQLLSSQTVGQQELQLARKELGRCTNELSSAFLDFGMLSRFRNDAVKSMFYAIRDNDNKKLWDIYTRVNGIGTMVA